MERRSFLQSAGAAVVAGTTAFSRGAEPSAKPPDSQPIVLVTSAESPLGEALAAALASRCQVRRSNSAATSGDAAPEAMKRLDELLSGCEAVVCLAQPPAGADAGQRVDYCTRGVNQLLAAAVRQNVRLVIFLGSLEVVTGYDQRLQVDETFRPIPTTDANSLPPYLGEFVCREFAREGKIRCVSLRLGHLRDAAGDLPADVDPLTISLQDVTQAVERTLATALSPASRLAAWEVFHIQSAPAGARFTTAKAQRILGYKPQT